MSHVTTFWGCPIVRTIYRVSRLQLDPSGFARGAAAHSFFASVPGASGDQRDGAGNLVQLDVAEGPASYVSCPDSSGFDAGGDSGRGVVILADGARLSAVEVLRACNGHDPAGARGLAFV